MGKCGNIALDIQTYHAGLHQPTHPNVISFEVPWHGYHYYMAYTPYPYGNGFEENPCIAASNDLIHWEKPSGLINPIATSEELVCDELKDSHLLYRKDLDRLELWYLGRIDGTLAEDAPLHCFRKVSNDGCNWSDYEVVYSFEKFKLVSPSVIYAGEYLFWGICHVKENTGLYFMRSEDGVHWSNLEKCDVPDAVLTDMWHGTVSFVEKQYHFVWVGNSGANRDRIYYANSDDGYRFTVPTVIVNNDVGWEFLYRPCLLRNQNRWYCYYGVIRSDGKWMISMSHGETLDKLRGISHEDLGELSQPLDALIVANHRLRLKQCFRKIVGYFTPKLMALMPLLVGLRILHVGPITAWIIAVIGCTIGSAIWIDRKNPIWRGFIMGTSNACMAAFLAEILEKILQVCFLM